MKRIFVILILYGMSLEYCSGKNQNKLKEIFKWKLIDFKVENDIKTKAIESGNYIPKQNIPFGLERWRNKLFVTIPRRMPGILSTLNYIDLRSEEASPLLIPYPDLESNRIEGSNIISVYRINVDVCDRLWIVDTGSVIDFEGNGVEIHRPRINIFNLKTDALIKEYELKTSDAKCDSSFTNILVDITADMCENAYAYLADPGSNALVVYSLKENNSWRVKHPYFNIDPLSADFNIAGLNFQWDDGIFGISLSSVNKRTAYRKLYFHPMTSTMEFSVSTEYLRNKALSDKNYQMYKIVGSRGTNGQSSASSYDEKNGILFYPLVNKNAIACWNANRYPDTYNANTTDVIYRDNVTMIYSSDLKVDKNNHLWVISNRLPITLYGSLNVDDYNFRIFTSSINEIIKGTSCETIRGFWSNTK